MPDFETDLGEAIDRLTETHFAMGSNAKDAIRYLRLLSSILSKSADRLEIYAKKIDQSDRV